MLGEAERVTEVSGAAGAWELQLYRRLHGPCCRDSTIPSQPL